MWFSASDPAITGLTVTFNAFTEDIDTQSTAYATVSGTAAAAATPGYKLQSSSNNKTWSEVGTPSTRAADGKLTTAADVDIKADTYYRIEISATGYPTSYVYMTGNKTAAQVITSMTTTATSADASGNASDIGAVTALKDQFGDDMADGTYEATTDKWYADGTTATSLGSAKLTLVVSSGAVVDTLSFCAKASADGLYDDTPTETDDVYFGTDSNQLKFDEVVTDFPWATTGTPDPADFNFVKTA